MNPIRYENDVAVFSSLDVDLFGSPDLYGFDNFIVVESREVVFLPDYKLFESSTLKVIHRYSRLARFKSTLLRLIGENNNVPDHIIITCKEHYQDSDNMWDSVRQILKRFKWSKYYDYIPTILYKLDKCKLLKITANQINDIIKDYQSLVTKFESEKYIFKRKYFPNMRFVALKLLEFHNLLPEYKIPFVRTERKLTNLSILWEYLVNC